MILLLLTALFVDQNAAQKNRERRFSLGNNPDRLPQFSLGYISELPIPSMVFPNLVKPTKVIKTKVFNIVTKYVYRNPVCVKINGKKPNCEQIAKDTNIEYTVTKGYDVKEEPIYLPDINNLDYYVESSENTKSFPMQSLTPSLTQNEIKELLIEDRLDQLETILPHYKRRRVYETSTFTVTRVKQNSKVTATLLVKNCVPQGYSLCPPKSKKRKSKVALWSNSSSENFFG